mmetsp:Transcript_35715/g.64318  ORF Transcript_35715/g.64318 Transcript_35715/m.64318 type:complete len:258 (+) Transcript_35715:755-1528(+)
MSDADPNNEPVVIEDSTNNNNDTEETKFSWPPLESNPEVFTTYLQSIGLPTTFSIGEVFGFDEDLLAFLPQPVLGIIVCYERLIPKSEQRAQDKGRQEDYDQVDFYMHQSKVLDNACGIIACLHAVFNSPVVSVDPSSVLGKFRQDTTKSTPAEKCQALEQNTEFQNIHRTHAAKGQSAAITSGQSKVVHHFIAYVLDNKEGGGKLVELDGTKAGPVVVGDCDGDVLRGSIREVRGKLERGEISESLSMMTLNLAQE